MFSGIIERLGTVKSIAKQDSNVHFTIQSNFTSELKVDQSVAHNGVCLTVTSINEDEYSVTAILETLRLTNLGDLDVGSEVNLERCLKLSDRLDGHIVQGHVDGKATVKRIADVNGSWEFDFELEKEFPMIGGHAPESLIIQKGSITLNGTSLTVTKVEDKSFSVAIIPYTYDHTNFKHLRVGDAINVELDILGKYIAKLALRN